MIFAEDIRPGVKIRSIYAPRTIRTIVDVDNPWNTVKLSYLSRDGREVLSGYSVEDIQRYWEVCKEEPNGMPEMREGDEDKGSRQA